jgi:molybdopterin converting factor small subunit
LNITLKYFSWIRVKLKKSHDLIEFNQTISFKELKNNLISKDPVFQEIFKDKSVKFFINLKEIDDENQTLNNGDIVAFLPPVTGG